MTIQKTLGLLALLALLLPCAALGADLTFGLGAFADYDSNVFRRENNVEDDVLFRIIPSVKLHEDRGQDFNYSLEYRVPIELAVENGDRLNDVDQWLDADALYHVNDRLDLFVRNDFRYLRSTLRTTQTLDSTGVPIINTGNRDRVTLNNLTVGASYRFTPRVSGNLDFTYRIFDSTRPDRANNFVLNPTAGLNYTLTSKQQVGAGLTYFHQQFEETINLVGSKSDTINAFLRWQYQLGETIGIEVSGGPSFILVNQDDPATATVPTIPFVADPADPNNTVWVGAFASCPSVQDANGVTRTFIAVPTASNPVGCALAADTVNVGQPAPFDRTTVESFGSTQLQTLTSFDTRSTSVDFFANASITKRWTQNFITSARYSRTQGVASGLGGTVIRDAVSAAADWDFRDRWNLLLRGDWVLRNSVTEANRILREGQGQSLLDNNGVPQNVAAFTGDQFGAPLGNNTIDTRRWGVVGRLTYQLFRNTTTSAQLTYNDQNSNGSTLGAGSDFQGWIATLGFRHVFEPIKLW